MLKLKRPVAFVFAMGGSIAFAGSMGNACVPGDVTAPCELSAWEFGASALYLQPSFGGNGLGYSSFSGYSGADINNNFFSANGTNRINNITPKWGWGFQIEGDYHFNASRDLGLNWYHLSDKTTGYLPSGSIFSGSADGFYAGRLQVSPKWDAINMELGQLFDFNHGKMLRLHAGVEFLRVKTTFTNYLQFQPVGNLAYITTDTISYNGFGPRIGGDFTYQAGHGVGLYVKGAGGLLIGSSKQNVSGYQDVYTAPPHGYGTAFYSTGNFTQSHHSVLVPELEAKLGGTYDYRLAQGNLTFDIGYMWMNYMHAIESYTGIGIAGGPSSAAGAASMGRSTTTNFDLNGLYFGMKWIGNI